MIHMQVILIERLLLSSKGDDFSHFDGLKHLVVHKNTTKEGDWRITLSRITTTLWRKTEGKRIALFAFCLLESNAVSNHFKEKVASTLCQYENIQCGRMASPLIDKSYITTAFDSSFLLDACVHEGVMVGDSIL